ncbi:MULTISPECIES: PIG-L family deacetylase [unclassified Streptomyces]|uniref:PIG-L deacetylase family protein n=1 Tax=unclassified Streptomyces TaxID=2593676 RepID=UPI0033B49E62
MAADPLTAAIDAGTPLVVLSPHLDDAVLSCGALMAHAVGRTTVRVATFFTEAGAPPYTLSGRRYLRLTGQLDAERLYLDRRAEDEDVLGRLGVDWVHLGLTDGLFRRKPTASERRRDRMRRVLPEPSHIYPTYRLHLATGRISPYDAGTLSRARVVLEKLASAPQTILLAPSGVGRHVDHVLVRTAAELSGRRVVYYSDFPYNQQHRLDPRFVTRNELAGVEWSRGLAAKAALVRGYRSQAPALFPGGRIPEVPEVYLLARGGRTDSDGTGDAPWLS